jgi:hypothetical protein
MTAAPSLAGHDSRTGVGSDKFLRLVLKLDAVVTAANGLAYLALAGVLEDFFGYSTDVQYPVGVFLLAYGALVFAVSTRPALNRAVVATFIVVNVLWTVLSLAVLFSGELETTTIGAVWGVLQAIVVGAFAVLQYIGLKRNRA